MSKKQIEGSPFSEARVMMMPKHSLISCFLLCWGDDDMEDQRIDVRSIAGLF